MYKSSVSALVFLAMSVPVRAQGIPPPSDLQQGEQYRFLMVTEGRRAANTGDISVYNDFIALDVSRRPALTAINTTWSAVCSTPSVAARDNTRTDPTPSGSTGVPIYTIGGIRLADDYDELWSGVLQATPGGPGYPVDPLSTVWSGTTAFGLSVPGHALGTAVPSLGVPSESGGGWIAGPLAALPGNNLFPLPIYGLSDVLTVPRCDEFKASPGLPINDNSTVTSEIVIPSSVSALASFSLGVKINHTFVGDLRITLEKVGVTPPFTVFLFPCNGANIDAVFVANGGMPPQCQGGGRQAVGCGQAPSSVSIEGLVEARSLLAFASLPAAGTWRLTVEDTAFVDVGTFCEWSLRLPRVGGAGSFVVTAPGCVNSAGQTVEMTAAGPDLGRPFTLTVRQLIPGAPGFLALGSDLPAFPISPSCGLHVNPLLVLPFTSQSDGGAQVTPFVVPFDRSIIGVQLAVQAFGVDPAVSALGLVGSPAGRATFGCR